MLASDDSHSITHLLEMDPSERLGENVSELVTCANVLNINAAVVDALPDEVVAQLNVLAPVVEDRVFAQRNRLLVVDAEPGGAVVTPK
mgnify:CR=1 FL=1